MFLTLTLFSSRLCTRLY